MDFILAMFPKCRQEAECILPLGTFVQLVDRETILKQKELLVNTVIGVLKNGGELCHKSIFLFPETAVVRSV